MKNLTLTIIIALSFTCAFSAPVIRAVSNGNWGSSSTWNLNRLPTINDTVIITAGNTVSVTADYYLNGTVVLKVYGVLDFVGNNSTIRVGNVSSVWVFSNGIVNGASNSQKLRIGNQQVFQGGGDPVVGPQTANGSSGSFVAFSEVVLPVKFESFTATLKNNNALIQWSTSEEVNAYSYQVERSFDGTLWSTIAYVSANGNSTALNNYSFTDKNITAKITYYRIKQVDVDGRFAYTIIRSIKTEVINNGNISIAALSGKVVLQFNQQIKGNVVVRLVSLNGQVMDQQIVNQPAGQVVLNAKTAIKGNYIVAVSNGQNVNVAKQIIL